MSLDPSYSPSDWGITVMALTGIVSLLAIPATIWAKLATPTSLVLRGVGLLAIVSAMCAATQLQMMTAIAAFFALQTLAYLEENNR